MNINAYVSSNDPMSTQRFLEASTMIVHEALQGISRRYGDGLSGDGLIGELQHPEYGILDYHNFKHSADVYERAVSAAKTTGLDIRMQATIGLAAASHDYVSHGQRGQMERASADWLDEQMAAHQMPAYYRQAARLMILGTEPMTIDTVGDELEFGQRVSHQNYPDIMTEKGAYIIATADIAGVYSPDGPLASRKLYLESLRSLTESSSELPSDVDTNMPRLIEFQRKTVAFVSGFQSARMAGEVVGDDHRAAQNRLQVIAYQCNLLPRLESGQITSLQEIMASDRRFAATMRLNDSYAD